MSLLNSSFSDNAGMLEAMVTSVDPVKFMCDCKTLKGQRLQNVSWLVQAGGTDIHTPDLGDRVLITTLTSYPLIIGVIPRIGAVAEFSSQIGTGTPSTNQGSSTGLSGGFQGNPDKAVDFTSGDRIQTNKSGGFVGILREGTAIIKASPVAQIITSRWDDLVRIIGRNYDLFCDFSGETIANIYGRLYRYYGFNRVLSQSQNSQYEYEEIHGDIVAGEYCKDNPFATPKTIPAASTLVIKKRLLGRGEFGDLMVETLDESGEMVITIADDSGSSIQTANSTLIKDQVASSTITITPGSIVVDYGGVSTVTIDPASVVVNHAGISIGTFDSNGVSLGSHGHFMNINSTGVHLG